MVDQRILPSPEDPRYERWALLMGHSLVERFTKRLVKPISWGWRAPTGRLRVLPDFIIIGAQRAGTTSLYRYLVEDPHIASAYRKEVHFFDDNFRRGVDWYRAHFPTSLYGKWLGREVVTGEASPYYLFHPAVPGRVAEILPHVKLIALLRNPVDRAFSHYQHEVKNRREFLPFEEAIKREPERLKGERERLLEGATQYSFEHKRYSYLARGIYVDQLEDWSRCFPEEQILVLKSEDFYSDPASTLERVQDFLDLPSYLPRTFEVHNRSTSNDMEPSMRRQLTEYFEVHNERLYEFLGVRFDWP